MRLRHTRYTDPNLRGGTIQRSLRLPTELVEDVVLEIAGGIPDIHTLTDAVTDALWLWRYEAQRMAGRVEAVVPANTRPTIAEEHLPAETNGIEPDEVTETVYPATPVGRPDFAAVDLPSDG